MFGLNLVGNGKSLKVYEQWNDALRAVLYKDQRECGERLEVGSLVNGLVIY